MSNRLSLASAALLLAGAASAQLAGLPSCAIKPAFAVIGQSECQLTEFKCICADAGLLQSLTSTVQQACTNTADLSSARAAASSICEPYAAAAASSTGAAAYAAASVTGTPTAAASSELVTATSTAKATTAAAPYAAGNATGANSTGASGNASSSGNLVVAGSAPAPPKLQDLGLVAAFLAVMGGAALF